MRYLVIAAAAVLLAASCSGPSGEYPPQFLPYPPSVSVNGVGTATGVADMAVISFSINVTAEDPGEAVSTAADLSSGAIREASALGIDENGFETTGYSIYMEEEYDYNLYQYTGRNVYHLTHSYVVNVPDIAIAGDVLGALVDGGATSIAGIRFTVSNHDELVAEARAKAIENAMETAEQLAQGLGVSLGSPVSVSEWIDYYSAYSPGYSESGYYYDSPDMTTGSTSVTMNVSISYAID
jgi:uncharacterized protein